MSCCIGQVAQVTKHVDYNSYIVARVQAHAIPCVQSMCLESTNDLSHLDSSDAS